MVINVAINGYGRIGRNILKALYESDKQEKIKIIAINDLGDEDLNAHLTKYDTVHGRFNAEVSVANGVMTVNDDAIHMLSERDPDKLPWKKLGIDVVLECTGLFATKEKALAHINAGAKKVIISAPASGVDATIVYGVNHETLRASDTVISNASCTTNCLAPIAKILNDAVGIEQGSMTTIHAYTNDQNLTDVYHTDKYRARAATMSMIPTQTGAAKAVGLVLPELIGKLDGMAVRVPTINVSLIDLNFLASRDTSDEEINRIVNNASKGKMKSILSYNQEPLVSVDFNHTTQSSHFDATQTKVNGRWVKVMAWYDNEWGFSNRMVDTTIALSQATTPT